MSSSEIRVTPEQLKELVDSKTKQEMEDLKKNDPQKFSLQELHDHQSKCNDSNCPLCSPIHDRELSGRMDQALEKVDGIKKKFAELTSKDCKNNYNHCLADVLGVRKKDQPTGRHLLRRGLGAIKRTVF